MICYLMDEEQALAGRRPRRLSNVVEGGYLGRGNLYVENDMHADHLELVCTTNHKIGED
jgi:hypothetical protein